MGAMDGWRNGWVDGWLDGWLDGYVIGWTNGWTYGFRSAFCLVNGTWWLIGRLRLSSGPKGRWFEFRSSRHVRSLGKSFTRSWL